AWAGWGRRARRALARPPDRWRRYPPSDLVGPQARRPQRDLEDLEARLLPARLPALLARPRRRHPAVPLVPLVLADRVALSTRACQVRGFSRRSCTQPSRTQNHWRSRTALPRRHMRGALRRVLTLRGAEAAPKGL